MDHPDKPGGDDWGGMGTAGHSSVALMAFSP